MELKTARLTLLIDPAKKAAFERLCAQQAFDYRRAYGMHLGLDTGNQHTARALRGRRIGRIS